MKKIIIHNNRLLKQLSKIFSFLDVYAELQRERRWKDRSLHDQHGHHKIHVHQMPNGEEDPQHINGEVRRARCVHESCSSARNSRSDANGCYRCTATIRRRTVHRRKLLTLALPSINSCQRNCFIVCCKTQKEEVIN